MIATLGEPGLDATEGAQLTVRHSGAPGWLFHAPKGGVYGWEAHRLSWPAEGQGLLECEPEDCALVNVSRPSTLLHPGSVLARLVTRKALTTPDGTTLNPHGHRVVDARHALYSFGAVPC